MLVETAAKRLNMSPQTLRLALQQKVFPFGVAVKTSENRYTYKIFPKRLELYLEGADYAKDFDGAIPPDTRLFIDDELRQGNGIGRNWL